MVGAVVPELHLEGLGSRCQSHDLVAQTNPEGRDTGFDQLFGSGNCVVAGFRITGAVAQEDAVRFVRQGLGSSVVDDVSGGGTMIGNLFFYATTPSQTYYKAMVANAANLWTSTVYPTAQGTDGQLVAEASRLERYAGNIWCRITRYVLAQ